MTCWERGFFAKLYRRSECYWKMNYCTSNIPGKTQLAICSDPRILHYCNTAYECSADIFQTHTMNPFTVILINPCCTSYQSTTSWCIKWLLFGTWGTLLLKYNVQLGSKSLKPQVKMLLCIFRDSVGLIGKTSKQANWTFLLQSWQILLLPWNIII